MDPFVAIPSECTVGLWQFVLYTFSCRRQRAEFASAAFMYKVCVLIEILFLKGGFLSAIASIGLLIALAMTPRDGKNQSKRMGK